MNKFDLDPTKSNLIRSIDDNITGRNSSIYNFLRLLNSQDDPLSIAVTASWGNGKTFFVKQCQLLLDSVHLSNNSSDDSEIFNAFKKFGNLEDIKSKHFRTAYFDAWEHDDEDDPLLSIMQCLIQSPWRDMAKSSLTSLISIASDLVSTLTPIKINEMTKSLLERKIENPEKIKQDFNNALSKLAPSDGKLVIFIDELDRCNPTYAVKLLEKIKHYFSNSDITFVFSVDLDQLQYTINNYYGNGFNGLQYLDRFFDLVIPLPEPDIDSYFESTDGLLEIDKLFKLDDGQKSCYQNFCSNLIKKFNFSLRQINHFYFKTNSSAYKLMDNILNKRLSIIMPSEENGNFLVYSFFLPFMNALIESDITLYHDFINGNATSHTLDLIAEDPEFIEYFNNIRDDNQNSEMNSKKVVSDIYNSIFNNQNISNTSVEISSQCKILSTLSLKQILISACSLLSSTAKFDFSK